jgi:acetaldehyde dehydrogenase (acetylating)
MPHAHDSSLQEVRSKVEQAYAAFQKYRIFPQERIDAIVEAAAAAGRAEAQRLAELAVEETRYGNVRDKVAKNLLNADLLPRAMRGMKTVGVLREVPAQKIVEIGVPVGVIAAILPTTNPTSTAIYKILIALKAGNAIVVAPHPRAARCTCETAEVLCRAAVKAGAPDGLVQWIRTPTMEATHALMKHERTAVILSTGGHGIVQAAYSSGKPAFGVGPGNVPVLLDRSADTADAVRQVVEGKSFDYGTVCSSEQALVCEESLRPTVIAELDARKAFRCDDSQKEALARILLKENYRINPECVGQSPVRIAEMAGFRVPADTSILTVELSGVGKQHPLSVEKLSPVLALYFVKDFPAALDICESLVRFGGLGHTAVIYAKDEARIREFALRIPAMRVLVNTPAPHGSTGITTNLFPSMTLGCGAMAGNITGDNVGPQHLINIKRLAYCVRKPEDALKIPPLKQAQAVSSQAPASGEHQTVLAAVERYLAERGVALTPKPQASASAPGPASTAAVAAQVVDRFLGSRRTVPSGPASAPSCPVRECPCGQEGEQPSEPAAEGAHAPPPGTEIPKPEVAVVDFVCENDVRMAIQQGRKIYIGRKTIVTPAARELADQHDILVPTHTT